VETPEWGLDQEKLGLSHWEDDELSHGSFTASLFSEKPTWETGEVGEITIYFFPRGKNGDHLGGLEQL